MGDDPVFVDPIVVADVMAAGFTAAEARFNRIVQAIRDGVEDDLVLGEFSWGNGVEKMVAWANQVHSVS